MSEEQADASSQPDGGFTLPIFLKTEFFRLASSLGIDVDTISTEDDCMDLMDSAVRRIERMKYEQTEAAHISRPASAKPKNDTAKSAKAKSLEDELRVSLKSMEDLDVLKKKNVRLSDKLRKEKLQREALETFVETQNKKISILVDHVERLMKAIKIESGKSIKAMDANRKVIKEKHSLMTKIEKQERVIATQNRYIVEIAEGSKVLEDQLQLMDEKFLDMRSKMDMTRGLFQAEVDRVKKKCADLRLKYSMATGGGLLDSVDVAKMRKRQQQYGEAGSSRPQSAFSHGSGKASPGVVGNVGQFRPGSASAGGNMTMSEFGNDAAGNFSDAMNRHQRDRWLSGGSSPTAAVGQERRATIDIAPRPGGRGRSASMMSFPMGSGNNQQGLQGRPSSPLFAVEHTSKQQQQQQQYFQQEQQRQQQPQQPQQQRPRSGSRTKLGSSSSGKSLSTSGGGLKTLDGRPLKGDAALKGVLEKIDRKHSVQAGEGGKWTDAQLRELVK